MKPLVLAPQKHPWSRMVSFITAGPLRGHRGATAELPRDRLTKSEPGQAWAAVQVRELLQTLAKTNYFKKYIFSHVYFLHFRHSACCETSETTTSLFDAYVETVVFP